MKFFTLQKKDETAYDFATDDLIKFIASQSPSENYSLSTIEETRIFSGNLNRKNEKMRMENLGMK